MPAATIRTCPPPGGPPGWLGGATPAALARTGRLYDGWLPYPPDPADYETGLAGVREAATQAGRRANAVTPGLFCSVLITDDVQEGRRALDAYSRANYGLPLEVAETIQTMSAGPVEHVTAGLRRYVAAGARHLACRIGALDLDAYESQLPRIVALRDALAGKG